MLVILLPARVQGQLFTEHFDYGATGGNLVGQGDWVRIGTISTIPLQYVAASSLSLGAYAATAGSLSFAFGVAEDAGKRMVTTPFSTGTTYASFLVKLSAVSVAEDYFFALNNSPTGTIYPARVFAKSMAQEVCLLDLKK